jgi:hypothetical protein
MRVQDRSEHGTGIEVRRRKLRRLSRWAQGLALVGMVSVIGYSVFLLFSPDMLVSFLRSEVPGIIVMPPRERLWLAFGLCMIPAGIFVAAMWQAYRFFALLGQARMFDSAAPRILVRLGGLAIGVAVAETVVRTLVILVMTSANPIGQRQLVIGISSTDFASLIAGLLFLAFALVMQEAARIEDEMRGFV